MCNTHSSLSQGASCRDFKELKGVRWIARCPWAGREFPTGSAARARGGPAGGRRTKKKRAIDADALAILRRFGKVRPLDMANRAIWNMRKRHEWLTTPLKKKRIKRATRVRCGLQDALDRKAGPAESK